MYELLLVVVFGLFVIRTFSRHAQDDELIPGKISDRITKLWDIVHKGMRDNRMLRAEKALLTILKIDEKNAAAYNRLGILYAKQKEYKDAIDCFEIACSIEPSASSLHNLGLIYYETENYEKSVLAFEEALKIDDTMAARHIALAKALEHAGQDKLMIEHLERAAEIEPTHESYRLLIKGYQGRGEVDKADILEDKLKKLTVVSGHTRRIKRPRRVVA